jgi:hypothetical protein
MARTGGQDDEATNDHDAMAYLTVLHADKLQQITKAVEKQCARGMLALLQHDLETMRMKPAREQLEYKQSGGIDMPELIKECKAAVLALDPKNGMCFESNGMSETDAQRKGRKLRDSIYAKWAHLWNPPSSLTWTKVPAEQKTGIYMQQFKVTLC